MTCDIRRPSCLTYAAHWRGRASQTARTELRAAYEQLAESYERLARQADLCRRVVLAASLERGEFPHCDCHLAAMDPEDVAPVPVLRRAGAD